MITLTRNLCGHPYITSEITFCKAFSHNRTVSHEAETRRQQILSKGLPKQKPITGVKNIVLVASGKGGVGKSTIAVNLAVALKLIAPARNVGLLDADVFGPSIPHMMNLNEQPLLDDTNLMLPLTNHGIKCMSMGFLIKEGAPLIWRGLMVMQAIDKLLRQVNWGSVDYLVVDTPPGTGDTHLSLVQNIPISGAVLVTTPQSTAVQVTRRGAAMFDKLNVPIIGIVENMSEVKCSSCSKNIKLFGEGVEKLANEIHSKVILKIPLTHEINSGSDRGVPIAAEHTSHEHSKLFKDLAQKVVHFLNKDV